MLSESELTIDQILGFNETGIRKIDVRSENIGHRKPESGARRLVSGDRALSIWSFVPRFAGYPEKSLAQIY